MAPTRVLVADDHLLFRAGLVSLFAGQPDFVIAGEAGNGIDAVDMARQLRPDLILMDIRMPGEGGLSALRRIRDAAPDACVVMLTASEDDADLVEAMKSGARGYLLKHTPPAELFVRLRAAMNGETTISGALAARLLNRLLNEQKAARGTSALSERELEVLGLVAAGKSNRGIAQQLTITENTVKKHLQSILEKLHLENRTQAAAYALREGIKHDDAPAR
jgi:two-component system, NarL family, nitrate/nitrite response regulator NarL